MSLAVMSCFTIHFCEVWSFLFLRVLCKYKYSRKWSVYSKNRVDCRSMIKILLQHLFVIRRIQVIFFCKLNSLSTRWKQRSTSRFSKRAWWCKFVAQSPTLSIIIHSIRAESFSGRNCSLSGYCQLMKWGFFFICVMFLYRNNVNERKYHQHDGLENHAMRRKSWAMKALSVLRWWKWIILLSSTVEDVRDRGSFWTIRNFAVLNLYINELNSKAPENYAKCCISWRCN